MPVFAKPGTGNLQVLHEFANGYSMNQGKFVVTDALGIKHKGVLDEAGKAIVHGLPLGAAQVEFLGRPHQDKADIFPFVEQPEAALRQMGAVKDKAMQELSSTLGSVSQQLRSAVGQVSAMAGQAQQALALARNPQSAIPALKEQAKDALMGKAQDALPTMPKF
jgi:type VI secretion system secreted protein VgrG